MKYKLNAIDRLIIPNLLPKEGSILDQQTAKEIRDKIRLKSEDFSIYGLEEKPDPMNPSSKIFTNDSIDPDKNPKLLGEIEVELSKVHTTLLKDVAMKLDNDKKVSPFNLETVVKLKDMRG